MSERIAADGSLVIEVTPDRWRLLYNNGAGSDQPLVESDNVDLRCAPPFADKRRITDGVIPADAIQRVVVGWSAEDTTWHLGLVLNDPLARARGGRWCELAAWYDPEASARRDAAQQAGQALARQIARPFNLIPPKVDLTPIDDIPQRTPVTQPALPMTLDMWRLSRLDLYRLELKRIPGWGRARLLRVVWYVVLAGVFAILSVTSLTSGISLTRPEWLVYLGFVSIGILLIAALVTFLRVINAPKHLVIDGAVRAIRWMRGKRIIDELPAGAIAAVYATHIVSKSGRRDKRSVQYGEINLLLRDNALFEFLLRQSRTDDKIPVTDDPFDDPAVLPLDEYNAHTHIQAAALAIARTLGVEARYDKRLR